MERLLYLPCDCERGERIRAEYSLFTVEDGKVDFTIRYCKKAAGINSTGFRILFQGEIYDILGVDHKNYKKKCLKYSCRKVRR